MSLYTFIQKHAFELATGLLIFDDEDKWQSGVRLGLLEIAQIERIFNDENKPYNAYDLAEAFLEYRKETVFLYRAEHERKQKQKKDNPDA